MASAHNLEDIRLFGYPNNNKALAEVLRGPRLKAIVAEKTSQVVAVYAQRIAPRSKSGHLLASVEAGVSIGGYRKDRWVGEVRNTAVYAAADEVGRSTPAPGQRGSVYKGHNDMRDALYSVLRPMD